VKVDNFILFGMKFQRYEHRRLGQYFQFELQHKILHCDPDKFLLQQVRGKFLLQQVHGKFLLQQVHGKFLLLLVEIFYHVTLMRLMRVMSWNFMFPLVCCCSAITIQLYSFIYVFREY
jgi:hypothetical protein